MTGLHLLVTGGSGYVGRATIAAALAAGHRVTATYYRHLPDLPGAAWLPLDLRERAAVTGLVQIARPDCIIHAAAAWDTPQAAQDVIVGGTQALVAALAGSGTRLIHLSTDMVFDGDHSPYRESDPPAPVFPYGVAKTEAEKIVGAYDGPYVIIRTSLVTCFAPPDPRTALIIAALQAVDEPAVPPSLILFTDEYRCPVRTGDLAAALVELVESPYCGVLHIAGPECLSRYELGLRVARCLGYNPARLRSGRAAASGQRRPRDCTLDISLARSILRTPLQPLP